MGRTIIIHEAIEKYVSTILDNEKCAIGLLIGQVAPQKDFIVHVAQTPNEEGKGRFSLDKVDDKWIAHHAQQVTRMLPGGLEVVGIFTTGPPDQMKAAQIPLRQCLFSIKKKLDKLQPIQQSDTDIITDRIVLQICSITKKLTCRTFDVADQKSSARPADCKYQSTQEHWIELTSKLSVDLTIPVHIDSLSKSLEKQIQNGLLPTCENIYNSLALLNGSLMTNESLLDSSSGGQGGKKSKKQQKEECATGPTYEVQLLHSQTKDIGGCGTVITECGAQLRMRGTVFCSAYVHNKATVAYGIKAIKEDAVRSLVFRCQLLCEDLADLSEEEQDPSVLYECPLRVFAPLHHLVPLQVCDYMFQDEGRKECVERLGELLSLVDVTEEEVDADRETLPVPDDLVLPSNRPVQHQGEKQSKASSVKDATFQIAGAVVGGMVALAAVSLSYLYLGET